MGLQMKLPKRAPLPMDRAANFSTNVSWGISDPDLFFALIEEAKQLVAPGYYFGDNLFTWCRNNSLFEDEPFNQAWRGNIANGSDEAIAWRRYILATLAYHCVQLDGDFVECGTYAGTGIKTVMDYLGGKEFPKTFWGYDTFDYNPVEGHHFDGQEEGFFEKVKERFNGYNQVRLVKGFIPDSFVGNAPEKIAFLHIDLNNAPAEIAVFDALFDRVVSGGVVVLDDYEWSGVYRPQKAAEDDWLEKYSYRAVPLPTGQSFIIKR